MDGQRFDELAKALAAAASRRSIMKGALGGAVGGALSLFGGARVGAADKVTICHKPGTPAEKTMQVPQSAVQGHMGHGDQLGACNCPPDKVCGANSDVCCPGDQTCQGGSCKCPEGTKPCGNRGRCIPEDNCCVNADCDDNNQCTDDKCDRETGQCVFTPVPGRKCDDNDLCTENDVCQDDGTCKGQPKDCDDGNPCTDDSCDPATGCKHVNNAESCDDGNECTENDVCADGVCTEGTPVENGTACSDGICIDGTCGPCRQPNETCTGDPDCCNRVCTCGNPDTNPEVGFCQAPFFQGFETDTSGWDGVTRVPTGTDGIPSNGGASHGQAASGEFNAFTRWGGYSDEFPTGGYSTSVDIYLDMVTDAANDTRFDWTSAINGIDCAHRRDFVFNAGYYDDTDFTGSGPRYVISASNNSGRANSFPKNPGRDPFTVTVTGWYTFQHRFTDVGGMLVVVMTLSGPGGAHSWTLSDLTDVIGTTVGGNRYGGFAPNEFPYLAIDNSARA